MPRRVLKQYSGILQTRVFKWTWWGIDNKRQWVFMAAKEFKVMPTLKEGLDFKLNMGTQLLGWIPGL